MINDLEYTQLTKEEYDNIFMIIAQKYNISHYEVKEVFINTLSQIFKNKIICCVDGNKYYFEKIGSKQNKVISFSLRIKNALNKHFIDNLEKYCVKIKIEVAKNMIKNNRILKVIVVKNTTDGVLVKHNILKNCIVPYNLIPNNEIHDFNIGTEHYLFLYSYSKKTANIILSAKNSVLDLYKVQKILKNSEVYKVNRYYGVRMKVYLKKHPTKIEFETLKLIFKNEKIKYIIDKT